MILDLETVRLPFGEVFSGSLSLPTRGVSLEIVSLPFREVFSGSLSLPTRGVSLEIVSLPFREVFSGTLGLITGGVPNGIENVDSLITGIIFIVLGESSNFVILSMSE